MITDEMLIQAADDLANAISKSLPPPEECCHSFSVGFEKRIKPVLQRANHPFFFRVLRSVASILIVILIGFGSLLTISAQARAAVLGWVSKQREAYIDFFFEGTATAPESTAYYPGWMPEDCKFVTAYEIPGGEVYIYTNSQNAVVQFSYISDPQKANLSIDAVDSEKKTVDINGCHGEIYISSEGEVTSSIVWTNTSQTVLFCVSANYAEDVLIKIAENIHNN